MARSEEYRLGEYAFPRGWFAVANGADVGRKPLSIHYFGQDLVLYRGESGRVVLLDAYCPHMGTHLGSGEHSATAISDRHMEGDDIRCPFHAWRFGPDGICNHVPCHDGPIPPSARIRSWRVEERYGIVFGWHDPEGLEPDFDIAAFPEWDDPEWVRWDGLETLCDLHHQIEIFDNMSDVAHLDHLHGTRVRAYENEIDGQILHQRHNAAIDAAGDGLFGSTMTAFAGYVGPGIAFGRFVELDAKQIMCITPIDDGSCRLWQTVMMRRPAASSADEAEALRKRLSDVLGKGLLRDGEIWKAKKPALDIMQMPGDGPFRQSRMWYSQFYNPRAKAAEIVARVVGRHLARGMPAFTAESGA